MGEEWKQLTDAEKIPFVKIATVDKEREILETIEYQESLKRSEFDWGESSSVICLPEESDGTISDP